MRVTIPPCTRKLPGPEPYTTVDLVSVGYEDDIQPTDVEAWRKARRDDQQADLAEQEAAYRRRHWLGHHPATPGPARHVADRSNSAPPNQDKARGPPQEPPQPAPTGNPPTPAQVAFIANLRQHVERGTGEPVHAQDPATKEEAERLIDQLKDARNSLHGHRVAGYDQGQDMAAGNRYCHHKSHGPRARVNMTVREWDWSIREYGEPLCRTHQQERK